MDTSIDTVEKTLNFSHIHLSFRCFDLLEDFIGACEFTNDSNGQYFHNKVVNFLLDSNFEIVKITYEDIIEFNNIEKLDFFYSDNYKVWVIADSAQYNYFIKVLNDFLNESKRS